MSDSGEVKLNDLYDMDKDKDREAMSLKEQGLHGEYFLVVRGDGAMHCSCGRPLNKNGAGEYACSAGWPVYRPSAGEVLIDKFGNLMFKVMPHAVVDSKAQQEYTDNRAAGGQPEAPALPSTARVARSRNGQEGF